MKSLRVFLKKEMKEAIRSWRLPVMLIVFLFLGISSPLLFKFLPALVPPELKATFEQLMKPTYEEIVSSLAKNLSQIGILVIILFNMGSVSEERGKGQLELLFARPASRSSLIWAKFLSSSLSVLLSLAVAFVSFGLYYGALFPQAPPVQGLVLGFLLFSLFALFVVSFTIFSSTLFSSGLWAGLLSGSFFLTLSFLPSLGGGFSRYSPPGLLEAANLIMRGQVVNSWDGVLVTATGTLIFILLANVVIERAEL
ncbi:MAG: ABC transporter permease [Coprothermobacterota bacterium]|nr:ABC transporter permease [Coprothermobacterota bacterium]